MHVKNNCTRLNTGKPREIPKHQKSLHKTNPYIKIYLLLFLEREREEEREEKERVRERSEV